MKKKRILSLMAAAAMTSSLMCSAVAPAYAVDTTDTAVADTTSKPDILYGDADGNGEVNANDSKLLMDYLVHGEDLNCTIETVDLNLDGKITVADVTLLKRWLNDNESVELPCTVTDTEYNISGSFNIQYVEAMPGDFVTVNVIIRNPYCDLLMTNFQSKIDVAEPLVFYGTGDYSNALKTEVICNSDTNEVVIANDNGEMVYPFNELSFLGNVANPLNTSTLFTMTIKIPENTPTGTYPVRFSDVIMTDENGVDITDSVEFIDSSIMVKEPVITTTVPYTETTTTAYTTTTIDTDIETTTYTTTTTNTGTEFTTTYTTTTTDTGTEFTTTYITTTTDTGTEFTTTYTTTTTDTGTETTTTYTTTITDTGTEFTTTYTTTTTDTGTEFTTTYTTTTTDTDTEFTTTYTTGETTTTATDDETTSTETTVTTDETAETTTTATGKLPETGFGYSTSDAVKTALMMIVMGAIVTGYSFIYRKKDEE